MNFQENLAQMPDISRLSGLEVLDGNGHTVHHIPAVEGKLGSLKLYNALSERFSGCLNAVRLGSLKKRCGLFILWAGAVPKPAVRPRLLPGIRPS